MTHPAGQDPASSRLAPSGGWRELMVPPYLGPVAALCLGIGLYALNAFLISTALPTAVIELKGVELISWAFTVYLVTAIVGGAAGSLLKQRLGTVTALLLPALAFLVGSLVAGLAGTMPMVLAGRALQGTGEGVIAALCYALIPELFPSRLVPKVFGAEAIVWALAAFGGPLLSGILTERISWRAAFLVNIPLALLFMALVLMVVPRGAARTRGLRFPGLRLLGCAAGIMLLAVAGILAQPWAAAGAVAASLVLLVALVLVDRRSAAPLFPSDAFRLDSPVGAGLWVALLMPLAQAATTVYLNITLQHLWSYGPTAAGYMSALMALSWSATALLVAHGHRPGVPRLLIRVGPGVLTMGLLGLLIGLDCGMPALVILGQITVGSGFGVSWGFLSQSIMERARPGERDRAAGFLPTVQSGGYAIGAAVSGLIANSAGLAAAQDSTALITAVTWVFGIATLFGGVAFLISFRAGEPRA
jgi:MFS family permease